MLFRLSNVWKSYGGTEILKGVSFQVNPSEKVGLVGRNGAGKTTVFRLVTGQEAPDDGEVIKMNGLRLGLLDQHVDFGTSETVHTAALSAFKEIHDIEQIILMPRDPTHVFLANQGRILPWLHVLVLLPILL